MWAAWRKEYNCKVLCLLKLKFKLKGDILFMVLYLIQADIVSDFNWNMFCDIVDCRRSHLPRNRVIFPVGGTMDIVFDFSTGYNNCVLTSTTNCRAKNSLQFSRGSTAESFSRRWVGGGGGADPIVGGGGAKA